METRTALTALFDGNMSEVTVSIVEASDNYYLEIRQNEDKVWVPLAEAKEFANKLNLWAIDNAT